MCTIDIWFCCHSSGYLLNTCMFYKKYKEEIQVKEIDASVSVLTHSNEYLTSNDSFSYYNFSDSVVIPSYFIYESFWNVCNSGVSSQLTYTAALLVRWLWLWATRKMYITFSIHSSTYIWVNLILSLDENDLCRWRFIACCRHSIKSNTYTCK